MIVGSTGVDEVGHSTSFQSDPIELTSSAFQVGTDFTSQERLAVQELCRPTGVYLSLEQIRWYVFDSPPEFAALIQLYAKLVACRDCFPRDQSRWRRKYYSLLLMLI